jgi:hypothetical protein
MPRGAHFWVYNEHEHGLKLYNGTGTEATVNRKEETALMASTVISVHLETIERARFEIQKRLRLVGKEMSKPTEKAFIQISNSLQEQIIEINMENKLFEG